MIAWNGGGDAMVVAALVIVVLMVGTWLVSLAMHNASIVDIVWGLGFVMVGWAVLLSVGDTAGAGAARSWLLVVMVSVWGLRLACYLAWRNHGKGEDFRYRSMRKRWGDRFGVVSLVTVFGVQGSLMWLVSLPLQLGQVRDTRLGAMAWIGVVVWLLGPVFEVVGDAQLARFKADPDNAGKVMDQGLWRYTRHPNYFGDACVWWGIALVAAETGVGAWGLVGAVVMTVLLRRVSGVTLLERSLVKRREGYVEYVRRTSPFVPRPPRPS
jgi:steroid 5-alpha reductase family enzyme